MPGSLHSTGVRKAARGSEKPAFLGKKSLAEKVLAMVALI